jgi:hypothetical protein
MACYFHMLLLPRKSILVIKQVMIFWPLICGCCMLVMTWDLAWDIPTCNFYIYVLSLINSFIHSFIHTSCLLRTGTCCQKCLQFFWSQAHGKVFAIHWLLSVSQQRSLLSNHLLVLLCMTWLSMYRGVLVVHSHLGPERYHLQWISFKLGVFCPQWIR